MARILKFPKKKKATPRDGPNTAEELDVVKLIQQAFGTDLDAIKRELDQ